MTPRFAAITALLGCAALSLPAAAPPAPLQPVDVAGAAWFTPPDIPALRGAWLVGAESQPGIYALRVRLAKGGRIPPHTHPDARFSTVLSGTLYVGYGAADDATKYLAVPAGGVYVAPAGTPHHLWARDGEVEYQESGVGPTANLFLKP